MNLIAVGALVSTSKVGKSEHECAYEALIMLEALATRWLLPDVRMYTGYGLPSTIAAHRCITGHWNWFPEFPNAIHSDSGPHRRLRAQTRAGASHAAAKKRPPGAGISVRWRYAH